uniref:Sema domain-containing protein n=1 Tax=Salvator merianae TaxID=96440 RepID=A0A8D0E4V9_SALMN
MSYFPFLFRDSIYTIDLDKSEAESITAGKVCVIAKNDKCANYIKVLIKRDDDTLFVCGTNAFNPTCRNYKKDSLEPEGDTISGKGICPYNPMDANVALFSGNELYSATTSDLMGIDPVIYRSLGNNPNLRTVKHDSRWLKDPRFIHAVDYGNYIYFFFQEVSVEYQSVEKVILPRIGRVCKNDMGGNMAVLDKHWTSFLKTRLICAVHEDSSFHFNIIQSVSHVLHINGHDLILALLTTPKNSIPGSAICAFDLVDINQAFSRPFKEQKSSTSVWTIVPDDEVPTPRPGSCAGYGSLEKYSSSTEFPKEYLQFMRTHVLVAEPGEPNTKHPWFLWTTDRDFLVALAVDNAAGPKEDHTVVYAVSENGILLKLLAQEHGKGFTENGIFLEEMNISELENKESDKRIVALQVDKPSGSLYVAFSDCVIRVPLGSCERHSSCKKACIASRDPYCGWVNGLCTYLSPGTTVEYEQDLEKGNTEGLENC